VGFCWSQQAAAQPAAKKEGAAPQLDASKPITRADLPALMATYKPPFKGRGQAADPAITFDRVDVIIEPGFRGNGHSPFLSIGRDGSYFFALHEQPGARFVQRLPAQRTTELQRLLTATDWLAAEGGEGAATHLHPDFMTVAVTRDGKTITVLLQGQRPQPYADLQKFFHDLAWQEILYYRLTALPKEERDALRDFHNTLEGALHRPGRAKPMQFVDFNRFYDIFAWMLDNWHANSADELRAAIDLMVVLERVEQAPEIARLRNDRELNLRSTVARALPLLSGEKSIPWLVDMIKSTAEARIELIKLGEPAIPVIVEMIEQDEPGESPRSIAMIRAYLDHWKTLPQPVDRRIVQAVIANMQFERRRDDLQYQRVFLELAGEPEPQPPTLRETAQLFLKLLKSGDEPALERLRDNVGSIEKWLALRETFDPDTELQVETLLVDKTSAFFQTRPLKDKSGVEIRVVVFLNLLRKADWRVGPALAEPAPRNLYKTRFLESHPDAKEPAP
jgi:hypothetical protein